MGYDVYMELMVEVGLEWVWVNLFDIVFLDV